MLKVQIRRKVRQLPTGKRLGDIDPHRLAQHMSARLLLQGLRLRPRRVVQHNGPRLAAELFNGQRQSPALRLRHAADLAMQLRLVVPRRNLHRRGADFERVTAGRERDRRLSRLLQNG